MSKTLGLDLGTNSIGWALVDLDNHSIIDTGVRIFAEGVNRDSRGKEISKNAARREARQTRRQNFRTQLRKQLVIKKLKSKDLCPRNKDEMNNWIMMDPYELRTKALDEKISLYELGRIFYHIAQRRGFKSNRKAGQEDSAIFKGSSKTDTISINETKEELNQGYRTLGELLYNLNPHEERRRNRYTTRQMYVDEFEKIWEKQKTFYPNVLTDKLKQEIGDPEDGLLFYQRPLRSQKHLLGKCTFESYMFFDKDTNRWVEKGKPVCSVSHPEYELFRAWQFVNTIKYGKNQALDNEQREKVVRLINSKDKSFEFIKIKKALKLEDEIFNYEDSHKVFGNKTHAKLTKLFSAKVWNEYQNSIWHCFFSYDNNEMLVEKLKKSFGLKDKDTGKIEKIHLDQDYSRLSLKAIRNILPFLKEGYLYNEAVLLGGAVNSFGSGWKELSDEDKRLIKDNIESISSEKYKEGELLKRIREFLKEQFKLSDKQLSKLYHHSQVETIPGHQDKLDTPPELRNPIVQKALNETKRVVNAIVGEYGKPDEIRVEMARELKQSKDARENQRFENMRREEKNDEVRKILDEFGLSHSRNNIQKYILWEESQKVCPYTGSQVSLEELFNNNKYQVEHIIPYSISLDDSFMNKTICEAKENQLKGNKTPWQFYRDNPAKWEKVKEQAKRLIAPNNYRKYQRFVSTKDYKLEDFIERQLNDTRYISKAARDYLKSVCPKVYVTQGAITNELRHLWGLNAILQKPVKTDAKETGHYWAVMDNENSIKEMIKWDFSKRNEIPNKLSKKGELVHGFVRDGLFIPTKRREDHRHHAIDALATACSRASYLKELSNASKKSKGYKAEQFPLPWESFFNEAYGSIEQILVSHAANRKVAQNVKKTIKKNGKKYKSKGISARGELHKDSVYGMHRENGKTYFHIRKPLEQITTKKHVEKIVDERIRSLIEEQVRKEGVDISSGYTIPTGALFEKDPETGEKRTRIHLPNRNGDPVPVRKVRIREVLNNAKQLKKEEAINQYVNPRNNHHIAIYEDQNGNLYKKVVSFWEAVQRIISGKPVIEKRPLKGWELIETFQENDMFLLGLKSKDITKLNNEEISKHLYIVQKIAGADYFMEICFRHHLDSRPDKDAKYHYIYIKGFGDGNTGWYRYNPQKVKQNILGTINI